MTAPVEVASWRPDVNRWRPSPHYSTRGRTPIRWIVLHADVSPREEATIAWLQSAASKVSYHALVHRDGTVTRLVDPSNAAWACGSSQWDGVVGLNRSTLSAAFANRHDGMERITPQQEQAMRWVIAEWRRRFPTIVNVLTHAQISPHRKSDPERIPNFWRADYATP